LASPFEKGGLRGIFKTQIPPKPSFLKKEVKTAFNYQPCKKIVNFILIINTQGR